MIARYLKDFEAGRPVPEEYRVKIEEARKKPEFTFAVVMDDKVLKITLPWTWIAARNTRELREGIYKAMRGKTVTVH